ncbi:MAG TPA: bifunctional riboflavin kinase/FAD synthetase [Kofleriaceae bacterium]|nr:bifunctional riboflavin kinase/FAD synthetase [Kofleriaceae bacterium]
MEVFRGHRSIGRRLRAPAVAIGNFDGVHRGHLALLERARERAAALGGESAALTFEPHPALVLAPQLAPRLITTSERKLELLAAAGVEVCVVEPFDRELAKLSPEQFARSVLSDAIGARSVVVGFDFTFGHRRAGTTALLGNLGESLGFEVDVVEAFTVDGLVASSTRVRSFVTEGNMAGARLLLGRDFEVCGRVVRGAGRGRGLGIPTANIAPDTPLLPASGIYAVWLELLPEGPDGPARGAVGPRLPGAASLGTNPTFHIGGELTLEVHVLDFDGDLYDRRVRVAFVERLRDERRFPGADELLDQIRRDVADTRRILAAGPPAAPSSDGDA